MQTLKQKLENFFRDNPVTIVVNVMTDRALLCLSPDFEVQGNKILVKFESLNDRGGNSVYAKSLQGEMDNALYVENEEENILMFQTLTLENYNHYIKAQYFNAPDFADLNELKNFIKKEEANVQ